MAGGKGTRLSSFANDKPKPLVSICGKSILQHEIECLSKQGFKEIVLTLSYKADQIIEYFGDGSRFGVNLEYYIEQHPLGNAGALFKLLDNGVISANEDFLLLNADSMFSVDFNKFILFHKNMAGLATLFTHPNSHPYDSGLIVAKNGLVMGWLTKEDLRPEWYKNRVNAGLHVLNSNILIQSGIDSKLLGEKNGEEVFKVDLDRQLLKPLAGTGLLAAYDSPEYVKDMGTPERLKQVERDLDSGLISDKNLNCPQKAIFLDRDGTINKYVGFLSNIDDFELKTDAAEAIKKINNSGYLAIVVANQPVVARGEVSLGQLEMIHNKMETLLGKEGAFIDGIYFCPHHPDKGFAREIKELKITCDCRKPKPGMLVKASIDFNIDLTKSWMIGDGGNDIDAGKNAGCRTALISNTEKSNSDIVGGNLLECVNKILNISD